MLVPVKRQRLIVEAFGCKTPTLNSVEFAYNLLEELSQIIDMRIVTPPQVIRIPVANAVEQIATNADYGISGTVLWLESGAQLHTWPEYRFLTLDIFSCKSFDSNLVHDFVTDKVKPDHVVAYNPAGMMKSVAKSLQYQVGGSHYKNFAIQPVEFIKANELGFIEGNIIKYICRYRNTKQKRDLEKIKHYVDLLMDLEEKNNA